MAARLKAGEKAPDVLLVDVHGQQRALSESWANGPALITFLRHFG
jgi:peroxiredoxin